MADSNGGFTLEGLAQVLRDQMEGTALQFAEVRRQFAEVGERIDDLRRENAEVAGMVRELSQVTLRQVDEIAEHRRGLEEQRRLQEEHRQEIRQIFARMEQHDARFEAMSRDIRQILDAIQRRGGDGGARQA
jgi:methyl-accepting chemotaxis protein